MAVRETSDENLIIELLLNERVILKYQTDSCGKICEDLKEIFIATSSDKDYKDITFLRINADNNPIARKHIEKRKQPIMNIYLKGMLLECRTVGTKEKMQELLDKLVNHSGTLNPDNHK